MFSCTIFIDLVTLTFDFLTLAVPDESNFIHPTHIPILTSYDYPFLSYGRLNLITLYRHMEWSLSMRCVTWRTTGWAKMIHIFQIPGPNLPIYFVTFRALYDEDW